MFPLVSICCITYKHFQFAVDAIEGFLMQQTNFEFEIVIGEDASGDGTSELLQKYKALHPGKIQLHLRKRNIGMMANFIDTLSACKGKYIAVCEGDDYWIDPLKLQRQVDYIDNHPGCNLVFTNLKVFRQDENKFYPNWSNLTKEIY